MKRARTRKRLPHFQVLGVLSRSKDGTQTWMRQMSPQQIVEQVKRGDYSVPPGYWAADAGTIALPKRRRGEKFVVRYTTIHEAVL